MDREAVRARIQELIRLGALPRDLRGQVWVGPSTDDRPCLLCQDAIVAGEIECEMELASTVIAHLHRRCWDAAVAAADADEMMA
jgi:hypothetical protein